MCKPSCGVIPCLTMHSGASFCFINYSSFLLNGETVHCYQMLEDIKRLRTPASYTHPLPQFYSRTLFLTALHKKICPHLHYVLVLLDVNNRNSVGEHSMCESSG